MTGFVVETIAPLTLARHNRLTDMYVLSPFVWKSDDGYEMLIRAVPRRDDEPRLKMAEIWYGRSADGCHFEMDHAPIIFPGPGLEDLDGCEDPTVIVEGGVTHLWYTGWNHQQKIGRLMYASGRDARQLAKQRRVIDSRPPYTNPKEATVTRAGDGWRLLFEYAQDEASRIAVARADDVQGPWEITGPLLQRREDSWDAWHLSTGPVIDADTDAPVMFYNGATREAHWRIGWATFDPAFTRVVDRCDSPLVEPDALTDGATDIAFAASAVVEDDKVQLYYSLSDKDIHRATLRRL